MGIVSNVIILSRTRMSGDKICIGGYCIKSNRYVRLLSNTAQALHASEPYQIGQVYELEYAPRYAHQMEPPHIEDIAVYDKKYVKSLTQAELLNSVAIPLSIGSLHISNLFEGKLNWENTKGYLLKNSIPSSSVVIARLSHSLEKKQGSDSFSYVENNGLFPVIYAVKYVGEQALDSDVVIAEGTPVRFSLARWWDMRGNGQYRSYLQISGFY